MFFTTISLVWSLTPPIVIEVPVPIQDSKRSCICVLLLGMSVVMCVTVRDVSVYVCYC